MAIIYDIEHGYISDGNDVMYFKDIYGAFQEYDKYKKGDTIYYHIDPEKKIDGFYTSKSAKEKNLIYDENKNAIKATEYITKTEVFEKVKKETQIKYEQTNLEEAKRKETEEIKKQKEELEKKKYEKSLKQLRAKKQEHQENVAQARQQILNGYKSKQDGYSLNNQTQINFQPKKIPSPLINIDKNNIKKISDETFLNLNQKRPLSTLSKKPENPSSEAIFKEKPKKVETFYELAFRLRGIKVDYPTKKYQTEKEAITGEIAYRTEVMYEVIRYLEERKFNEIMYKQGIVQQHISEEEYAVDKETKRLLSRAVDFISVEDEKRLSKCVNNENKITAANKTNQIKYNAEIYKIRNINYDVNHADFARKQEAREKALEKLPEYLHKKVENKEISFTRAQQLQMQGIQTLPKTKKQENNSQQLRTIDGK